MSGDSPLVVRPAREADLSALHALIEGAYRGESARAGWTNEADLVEGPRTSRAELAAMVIDPERMMLLTERDGRPIGCVALARTALDTVHLGMVAIDPAAQAGGLGRRLLAAAERVARDRFGAARTELSVISVRTELRAYYERRGYVATGELRPFPVPLDPPLALLVMAKPIDGWTA